MSTNKVENILSSATSEMNKIKEYQKRLLQKYSNHSAIDSINIDGQDNVIVNEIPTFSECSTPSTTTNTDNFSSKPRIQLSIDGFYYSKR